MSLLTLPACPLGMPPLRPVPHDLGEAPELAPLVPERGHHTAHPEAGAVLADVPAVVLAPARLQRLPHLPLGNAPPHVLGGEEEILRLAEDLVLPIAEQSFRRPTPATNLSLG